jgi:hypothetical protein
MHTTIELIETELRRIGVRVQPTRKPRGFYHRRTDKRQPLLQGFHVRELNQPPYRGGTRGYIGPDGVVLDDGIQSIEPTAPGVLLDALRRMWAGLSAAELWDRLHDAGFAVGAY